VSPGLAKRVQTPIDTNTNSSSSINERNVQHHQNLDQTVKKPTDTKLESALERNMQKLNMTKSTSNKAKQMNTSLSKQDIELFLSNQQQMQTNAMSDARQEAFQNPLFYQQFGADQNLLIQQQLLLHQQQQHQQLKSPNLPINPQAYYLNQIPSHNNIIYKQSPINQQYYPIIKSEFDREMTPDSIDNDDCPTVNNRKSSKQSQTKTKEQKTRLVNANQIKTVAAQATAKPSQKHVETKKATRKQQIMSNKSQNLLDFNREDSTQRKPSSSLSRNEEEFEESEEDTSKQTQQYQMRTSYQENESDRDNGDKCEEEQQPNDEDEEEEEVDVEENVIYAEEDDENDDEENNYENNNQEEEEEEEEEEEVVEERNEAEIKDIKNSKAFL